MVKNSYFLSSLNGVDKLYNFEVDQKVVKCRAMNINITIKEILKLILIIFAITGAITGVNEP